MKRVLGLLLITVSMLKSHFVFAESGQRDALFIPPGKLYSVGSHRLHINCIGTASGKPTVIIDAGLGSFSLEWNQMQEHLSANMQTCSYDRAGYGWSDPGPFPRTTETIVAELRRLLEKADIPPPYILVGHSFGGYNMMYFAKQNPEEVKGLVLIDSSHPDQTAWMPSVFPESASRRGRTRFVSMPKLPKNYPNESRILGFHLMNAYKARNALRYESMNFEISARQVARMGDLKDVPLVVLTRGEPAWKADADGKEKENLWSRLQSDLSRMSRRSQHIYAQHSGHYIHLDQPLLVENAIIDVMNGLCEETFMTVSLQSVEAGEC